jgi:hypothetical protein
MKILREEGCQVLEKVEESEFGIFGWIMDPEGTKWSYGNHRKVNRCG